MSLENNLAQLSTTFCQAVLRQTEIQTRTEFLYSKIIKWRLGNQRHIFNQRQDRKLDTYRIPVWQIFKCHVILLGQGKIYLRPVTVKCRQISQSNCHSTIGTRQTEYHEALLSSNMQSHLTSSFADDCNTSWYSVCRVPMVEWRLDCENCRHLTAVGLHNTGPWWPYK